MSIERKLSQMALMAITGVAPLAEAGTEQTLYSKGDLPSFTGPEATFSGKVKVDMIFPGDKTPYSGAYVTFEPGARTAWHSHPAGQHMVVTKGTAITATRSGQVIAFNEGETVWCPEGIDHWHGAGERSSMTHFVVTGSKEGEAVTWKDKVTDEQYHAALQAIATPEPEYKALDQRHRHLVLVASYAAHGDTDALSQAINQALDNKLSINELKETLLHVYPYAGFPKSLNALAVMMGVVEHRKTSGIKDIEGDQPMPLPEGDQSQILGKKVQTELVGRPVSGPLFDFAPAANVFLQKHLFGDVFARGLLSHQDREIITIAILSTDPATMPQLGSHIGMAINTGLSAEHLTDTADFLNYQGATADAERLNSAIHSIIHK